MGKLCRLRWIKSTRTDVSTRTSFVESGGNTCAMRWSLSTLGKFFVVVDRVVVVDLKYHVLLFFQFLPSPL